jgi:hypothetical protein
VHGEALGQGEQLFVERAQALGGDRRLDLRGGRAVELVAPGRLVGAVVGGELLLELGVAARQLVPDRLGQLLDVLALDDALLDQPLAEESGHALLGP